MSLKTEIEITCDSCSKDISPIATSYEADYILKVTAYNRAYNTSGVVFGMSIYPLIEQDLYFCGLRCMATFKPNGGEL